MEATRRVALTGAGGFLGFHTRAVAHANTLDLDVIGLGAKFDSGLAGIAVDGSDRLVHLAGVNRGSDAEVVEGNLLLARQVARTLRSSSVPPKTVVYANSTQADGDSAYGAAKSEVAAILEDAASAIGADFMDIRLPNLYGEHGRPFYNSVVATFCHSVANGRKPEVHEDRQLRLLHAGAAAEVLLGLQPKAEITAMERTRTVRELLGDIKRLDANYSKGAIPDFDSDYDQALFNTFRSYLPGERKVIRLEPRSDSRGSFFEVIKSRGGGQTSFSSTLPGVTRGQHYHRRKIERFVVVSGSAEISMRRLFSSEVETFRVSGGSPCAVDMPTLWAHKIVNTGDTPLLTMFWINEMFDPSSPDTFPEEV
jgi:UDP-2-acetamido-2,6-beta-L-arabino-hexul-4-ose reductase